MTIMFKGRAVEVDGAVVGTIKGLRINNPFYRVPYSVRLVDGQSVGAFACFEDARNWCRRNESVLAELVLIIFLTLRLPWP